MPQKLKAFVKESSLLDGNASTIQNSLSIIC